MTAPIVVKVGGGADVDRTAILADVAELVAADRPVVVVHGGGPEIDRVSGQLGVAPKHLTSASGTRSRHTDAAALDAMQLALCGRVKPRIVTGLTRLGVHAVGLTGLDGPLVEAARKTAIKVVEDGRVRVVRDDRSGRITNVDSRLLETLTAAGWVPVLSPPACGGAEGPLNVDADRMAAAVAAAVGAAAVVFLSDVPGLLRDRADPSSVVAELRVGDPEALEWAAGRMRHKVLAAQEALVLGVPTVVIGDGRLPNPIRAALSGRGTTLVSGVAAVAGEAGAAR
jgi:acetylglutamate/LysW-gamma-L-alpha-aminoadipate kinase